MNRRITKSMAEVAAKKMKEKAYAKKIDKANNKLNEAGEKLVRKYIPAPVLSCVNVYSDYFYYSTGASITAIKESPEGWARQESNISVKLSFKIPSNGVSIKVDHKEYVALRKLYEQLQATKKECDEFGDQVYNALVALKTEKAVEKELPEAMKYLVWPEVKAVPMPVFSGLRDIIGKIEDDNN